MRTFDVLTGFQSAVSSAQVTLHDGTLMRLAEGLSLAVTWLEAIRSEGKKIILFGNGGSAAIAGHQAVDLWRNAGVRALSFNEPALLTCIANDFGYPQVFSQPVQMFCDAGDLVIAISSSGQSANILNAVTSARKRGCLVLGLSGFEPDNPLRALGDLNVYVPSRSYGIVECAHLLLLHSTVDELIRSRTPRKETWESHEDRYSKSALFQSPPTSAD